MNRAASWTNDRWFVTLDISNPNAIPTMSFYPRSGAGNSTLGAPQTVPATDGSFIGIFGDNVVGMAGATSVQFFRESVGTWSAAGVFAIPTNHFLMGMTDEWMVLRRLQSGPSDSNVLTAYPLDTSGATVVVGSPQVIAPDPNWSTAQQRSFGANAALDGEVLVATTQSPFSISSPLIRVLRVVNGTWTPVGDIGGNTGGPAELGQSVAVDDGATIDRIVTVSRATPSSPRSIDIFSDSGAGFVLEQALSPDPNQADTSNGAVWGAALGIDDTTLAVTARALSAPSAESGHQPVPVRTTQIFRKSTTWAREVELDTFTNPVSADITSLTPTRYVVDANHVAVSQLVVPDPPIGCGSPCFVFGYDAWSLDRVN